MPRDTELLHALHRLHRPDTDPGGLDRRNFLKLVGLGVGAGMVGGTGSLLDVAGGYGIPAHAAPIGPNDGILLVIGMYGGNDGLDTVVTPDDGSYRSQRGALALPWDATIPIGNGRGLHRELGALANFWNQGNLAIVEGLGYPNGDLSHFNSLAYWMSARPNTVSSTGWIGRWLDGELGSNKDLWAAAEVGSALPMHLLGAVASGTVVPSVRPSFGGSSSARERRIYSTLATLRDGADSPLARLAGDALVDQIAMSDRMMPYYPEPVLNPQIGDKLEIAARVINANLGFRVLTAGWHDFDSHAGQPGMHGSRMREFNAAITRFFSTLDPAWSSRVTVMTFSEFGRTPWSNYGVGTDHGTAAPHLVFGKNVRGGLYGQRPSSAGLGRWDRMAHTVDFRSYYASIIDGWLGGGSSEVLGGNYENLGLFARPPGTQPDGSIQPIPTVATPPSAFVPIVQQRLVDTRIAHGAPQGPMAPSSSIPVQIAGVAGIPDQGVVAVVANVTAVDATTGMFFSVYPGGTPLPATSSLNAGPGRPVPNLVVMRLGPSGAIEVYNSHGNTHCLVDVFGYFTTSSGDNFVPVSPSRLLDTRTGNGGFSGPVGHEGVIDLQVAGRGNIPPTGATAVVMNLTAVTPQSPGFLRASPTGRARSTTSNVNFYAGDTVPNLVLCEMGDGGRVSIDAVGAGSHVLADVFGYFTPGSGGRLRTVQPTRVVDTRDGIGAPVQKVSPNFTLQIPMRGVGVIGDDATAVVVNLTATNVAGPSFVTIWPGGEGRPDTSNLNVLGGQTLANLAFCRLGADGTVMVGNPLQDCDIIVDVVGYFAP